MILFRRLLLSLIIFIFIVDISYIYYAREFIGVIMITSVLSMLSMLYISITLILNKFNNSIRDKEIYVNTKYVGVFIPYSIEPFMLGLIISITLFTLVLGYVPLIFSLIMLFIRMNRYLNEYDTYCNI